MTGAAYAPVIAWGITLALSMIVAKKFMNFLDWNKKVSKKIGSLFPNAGFSIYDYYLDAVKDKLGGGQVIVDIGGEKSCKYSSGTNEDNSN
jgi:hypothetical protein